jgi:hypothetical protein
VSEEPKSSVLAKCGELAPDIQTTDAGYLKEKIGDFSLSWKDLGDFRLIDLRNDSDTIVICFWEQLPENDPVWPLAAQILGIEQPAQRPSDDLLWEAWKEAKSVDFVGYGHLVMRQAEEKNRVQFDNWLATLPADPLQADREIVRNELFGQGLDRALIDEYATADLINALKRLAGLEVKS